ncbi:class I adenylate-forming enzyme family protein [Pelagibius sp. Alg239-R121]|uniref:class I adenylate-forming enzyme family protein n=1 Tax=Pelagibius sp. Alg239-R121 TaxID=2993448 RepID=UPI0024A67801|nr:AMP-binding protein [Pelagibius sp. Alg239-R121]
MRRIHEMLDLWLEERPEAQACIDFDGRSLTFRAFSDAVAQAAGLLQSAGVRAGDRVTLVSENSVASAAVILACSRLDAWVNPLNARMTESEIKRIVAHCKPRVMIFTHKSSDAAARHAATFSASESDKAAFGQVMLSSFPEVEAEPVFAAPEEQVAALLYTTGTTGDPKGVMLSHRNLLYMAEASKNVRGLLAGEYLYCVLPMTHVFAFASAFLASIRAGALIRYVPRFVPADVLAAYAEGVSVMQGVPAMYAQILKYCADHDITDLEAPKLRYLSAGGAPLDVDWKRKIEDFFGLTLHNGYGMTETSPGISATVPGHERSDDSAGPPLPGLDVRLMPPPGQSELRDGVGEIVVKGPNVMMGYYKNPQATAEVIDADGYLHTGDLGRFDETGWIYVVGRCKELIIRSGFNVYPPEVETALNSFPGVVQSAVVGERMKDGNEDVIAFVEIRKAAGVTEEALRRHVKDRLAPYKVPSRMILTDRLPAAGTGKILKHKLIDFFARPDGEMAT